MIVASAALCLALNVYQEARGEMIPGQYAVAQVTINRADKDPFRVCEEVFKSKQFSWTINNVKRKGQGWQISKRMTPKDDDAWERAQKIAKHALAGRIGDLTQGAKFYHTTKVQPYWVASMTPTRRIGNHIFYTAKISQG